MSTMKDLLDLAAGVRGSMDFFGSATNFLREWEERSAALGTLICEEMRIGPTEAARLPHETTLGPRADATFAELKRWAHTQGA